MFPVKEWRKRAEACEELVDIKAYGKDKSCSSDSMPFEQAARGLRGGGCRIIYEVDDRPDAVLIITMGPRGKSYKKM